ncbi:MAG: hypothetical protein K2Q10_05670, partial [Rhodospirillales bacterium]|nr:hypothetical protein [Rhodospirillales bacterium]
IAAAGSLNPLEMSELAATAGRLQPVVTATGGGLQWLSQASLPDMRRVRPGRVAAGHGWFGLQANGDHIVTAVRDIPVMPAGILLVLGLGGLMLAWWREGR